MRTGYSLRRRHAKPLYRRTYYTNCLEDAWDGCNAGYILGQFKMEQQTPIPPWPQIKDEAAQKPKRVIFPSLIWGEGRGYKFSIHFVHDRSTERERETSQTIAGKGPSY